MSREVLGRRGLVLVLSSPSGAGKTTISRSLLADDDNLSLSISATTRKPRRGEVDGKDYHFVSQEEFRTMVESDQMLEYATVFGNSYGTPRGPVEEALKAGKDILFDIDWQGTQQVSEKIQADLARIFILPPSVEELERRLRARAQDPEEVVQARMAEAASEMSHHAEYDYIVVNEDIAVAKAEVRAILMAERCKKDRQIELRKFVQSLHR